MDTLERAVAVIDDSDPMREELIFQVKQQGFTPMPIMDLSGDVVAKVQQVAKYAICDLRLGFMTHDLGATIVAELTKKHVPSILFSEYKKDDLPEFRHLLYDIPRFYSRDELNAANLHKVFQDVEHELVTESAERRPYKALVRIEQLLEGKRIEVIVPAWKAATSIEISLEAFPPEIQPRLHPDVRFFANVNLHAEDETSFYIQFLHIAESE